MLAPYVIGILLALGVSVFAAMIRLDGDRAFYPTVLIVVAAYYILFSVIGGTTSTIIVESAIAAAFLVMATMGFKRTLWLVVAGLVAHGVFDLFHGLVVSNPGVPVWWPAFCLSYDLTAAACLAWMLLRRPRAIDPGAAPAPRG